MLRHQTNLIKSNFILKKCFKKREKKNYVKKKNNTHKTQTSMQVVWGWSQDFIWNLVFKHKSKGHFDRALGGNGLRREKGGE